MSPYRYLVCLLVLLLLTGCEVESPQTATNSKPKGSRWKKGSKAATAEKSKGGGYVAKPRSGAVIRRTAGYEGGSSSAGGTNSSYSGGGYSGAARSESQAIDRIGKSVRESLELGPSLVIWGVDRSESASRLVQSTAGSVRSLYAAEDIAAAAQDDKLLTALVGFGEKTDFLLDPPTADSAKVKEAFEGLTTEAGSREATFAALKLALEKYLPLRTKERRQVIVVLVTDEPGDDVPVLDDVTSLAQKNAIPIFAIGPSVPLGKVAAAMPVGGVKPATGSDQPTPATDVLYPDWVSFDNGAYGASDVVDSGLGPWSLERLCRDTSGEYLAVGSAAGTSYGNRLDPAVMSKYAPEYLSVSAMEASLQENKCRAALVKAAKLPPTKATLLNPQTVFPRRNEAEMARILNRAQLDAAKLEEGVNDLYTALAGEGNSAESDRTKLTGTRWQVAYDTAFGRAAAAKVRIEGYNLMLAALKRGKPFVNESSTTWLLESSDKIETGSAMQKLADKAKAYLERVQEEHPNTPWARLAQEELRTPLGWTWREQ